MPCIIDNQNGVVTITDECVAVIAGLATIENAGVVGMASKTASEGFWEVLKRENARKGVTVAIENNKAVIDLHIMVEYGVSIFAVASNVKDNVTYQINNFSGVEAAAVNVHVEGVRVQSE